MDSIAIGDFIVYLDKAQSSRSQRLADLLMEFGLIDLVRNFQQRRQFWDLKTWTQVRKGAVLRSICDYIHGTDHRRFKPIRKMDMHHYTSATSQYM